ncbi:MAG: heavy-metal-associated domain-containing protein [Anaerolineales bacterium]|nr:heavy-metal-associated domain-containing protein [Anaerolineales bacterium]
MERLFLIIPKLYADHHVTRVRQLLFGLNGVEDVYASAAFKEVAVLFDPEKISHAQLQDALINAGYVPGDPEVVERTPDHTSDPAWDVLAQRAVTTNPVDLQMSGEFRKY